MKSFIKHTTPLRFDPKVSLTIPLMASNDHNLCLTECSILSGYILSDSLVQQSNHVGSVLIWISLSPPQLPAGLVVSVR